MKEGEYEMIEKVKNFNDCKKCDEFLTLLIQDERKYDKSIDENFVVNNYFINMINDENILLMYKEEDKPVGYIFAKKIDVNYLIDGLYVDADFRTKGIATRLIKEVIKEINLLGNFQIYINVLKENKIAVTLYKKLGFTIEKENRLKYSMIYNKYKLVNTSATDIERIKRYKLENIFEYAKDLEQTEIEKINNYVNKNIPNQIGKYKDIIINDNIVGSILLTEIDNGVLLDEIFIEKQYRNKGIGGTVIKEIITNINNNLYLWVYKDNIGAIKLYNRLGFAIKEETDSRYYMEYIK